MTDAHTAKSPDYHLAADATAARLAGALQVLREGRGRVVVEGSLMLEQIRGVLHCQVPDPFFDAHRCAEETAVLLENGQRLLATSSLAASLPDWPRQWRAIPASD